jgi:hypothetical protein
MHLRLWVRVSHVVEEFSQIFVEAARSFKRAAELGDVVGQFFSCLDVVI